MTAPTVPRPTGEVASAYCIEDGKGESVIRAGGLFYQLGFARTPSQRAVAVFSLERIAMSPQWLPPLRPRPSRSTEWGSGTEHRSAATPPRSVTA